MNRYLTWAATLVACALLASCSSAPLTMGVVDPEQITSGSIAPEAQNCTLQRRASVPVTMAGLPLVSATINGRQARLILDTGAESSIISVAAAKRLGVTTRYDFDRSMHGIGEAVQTGDARLDGMMLGGATLNFPRVLVGPIALNLGSVAPDGLLGASLLAEFDLDLDLPNRRLDLYERMDCPSFTPPWSGHFTTLETTRSLSSHPFFPIQLNGHTLSASLDTGAQRTVLSAAAAKRAGIGAASRLPGAEIRAQGATGETLPAEMHALRLSVGDISGAMAVMVTPLALPNDIDALLGADFLQTHRVWLSYGSRRLFVAN